MVFLLEDCKNNFRVFRMERFAGFLPDGAWRGLKRSWDSFRGPDGRRVRGVLQKREHQGGRNHPGGTKEGNDELAGPAVG
jgi:hypothetical protein